MTDKPIEYSSPLSLEERRRILYENYAAGLSQTDWDKMEEEERQKIISMGKGRSLNFQFSTQRGSMQQIKSQLKVYEVSVNSGEIEHFYIASDSISSAMTAARNFGFIPISAKIMPEPRS